MKRLMSNVLAKLSLLILIFTIQTMEKDVDLSQALPDLVQILDDIKQELKRVPHSKLETELVEIELPENDPLEKHSTVIANQLELVGEERKINLPKWVMRELPAIRQLLTILNTEQDQKTKNTNIKIVLNLKSENELFNLTSATNFLALSDLLSLILDFLAEKMINVVSASPQLVYQYFQQIVFQNFPEEIRVALAEKIVLAGSNLKKNIVTASKFEIETNVSGQVSWSKNNSYFAVISRNYNVAIYQQANNSWKLTDATTIFNTDNAVLDIAWNNKNQLAIASTIGLFIWQQNKLEKILDGYFNKVSWNPSELLFVAIGKADKQSKPNIYILNYEAKKLEIKRAIQFETQALISWSPKGTYLAFITDQKLHVWNVKKDTMQSLEDIDSQPPVILWNFNETQFSCGNRLCFLSKNGSWKLIILNKINKIDHTKFDWNPTKNLFAFIGNDRLLHIGSLEKKEELSIETIEIERAEFWSISWFEDGNYLAGGSINSIYILHHTEQKWKSNKSTFQQAGAIQQIIWLPHSPYLITLYGKNNIQFWNYKNQELDFYFESSTKQMSTAKNIIISPNGQYLTVVLFGFVQIYDISWLQKLKDVSLEQAIVFLLKSKNLQIPKELREIKIPYFLELALKSK